MISSGRFSLVVEDRYGTFADEYSFHTGSLVVGRGRDCNIVLPSENVSRRHARLTLDQRGLSVEDLASANGVRVNESRIDAATALKPGDVVGIGDFRLHVRTGGPPKGVRSLFLTLEGIVDPVRDQTFEITSRTTLVGRGAECGLVVADESVSRAHARLLVRPDGTVVVEDADATNGVFVNDRQIRVWQLGDGDLLRFGDVSFRVVFPGTFDAGDLPTARSFDLGRPPRRWVGPAIVAFVVAAGLFSLAIFMDRTPVEPVSQPSPELVSSPAPLATEPAGPTSVEYLAASQDALSDRRLDEAAALLGRVLALEPANEEAVILLRQIGRERDAQAALEAGLQAAALGRLDPASAYLVQVPAESVFAKEARARLRQMLPELDSRVVATCSGGARRSIACIQARALQSRVRQALEP